MPYLVRHAHAGDKQAWQGPDSLRPLSVSGRQEAHGLLTQLRDYPIRRILSGPAVRCLQTVLPLAERRDLRVENADALLSLQSWSDTPSWAKSQVEALSPCHSFT
jgi:broad specificity phosphatase PhoE